MIVSTNDHTNYYLLATYSSKNYHFVPFVYTIPTFVS